jgi:hypothetical protein
VEPDVTAKHSVIGRLLAELSWAGASIRGYRRGGLGYENVLTAEVLGALDFLPRARFLGAVVSQAHGAADARHHFVSEAEHAEIVLLPEEIKLRPGGRTYQDQLVVQPDGLMVTPGCHVLIEAKRIRTSSFQPEQLAREYLALTSASQQKTPLLLLLLGTPPPLTVKGAGKLSIEAAVGNHLASVVARSEHLDVDCSALLQRLPASVAWITWTEIQRIVAAAAEDYEDADPSVLGCIHRLAASVVDSIARHS